jgi:hypothetical protein
VFTDPELRRLALGLMRETTAVGASPAHTRPLTAALAVERQRPGPSYKGLPAAARGCTVGCGGFPAVPCCYRTAPVAKCQLPEPTA